MGLTRVRLSLLDPDPDLYQLDLITLDLNIGPVMVEPEINASTKLPWVGRVIWQHIDGAITLAHHFLDRRLLKPSINIETFFIWVFEKSNMKLIVP